ncbi:ABC transporter permease subunit [Streptomyces sp. PTM05]|uniref:ABC transporter permease subunit n=1 Tax=Streptantibioticus parmotrematis TaxID=2873249 RepID=A0ABS7QLJ5_9ACTN|nr:ABC transporter permease [Streptantibioticus parmotrematis]MBY8883636.1 ABC transporter permease subunit [Streptantibioticus parmotrematis]
MTKMTKMTNQVRPQQPTERATGRLSRTRILALVRKELNDFRRNRLIATTMAVMPLLFMIEPVITVFKLPANAPASRLDALVGVATLELMLIPALVPAVVASYAVVGEREQGTLEPVLTTPIRPSEFLLGKALAVFLPALGVAYTMYGVFLAAVGLFAHANVAHDIFEVPRIVAQLLFTPLLALWSIWAAIAVSTRAGDVRVAQQLSSLASLPPLAVTALVGFDVVKPTTTVAVVIGAALLLVDTVAWRLVSAFFHSERLVTGAKPA